MTGTVAEMQWVNPHAWLWVNVTTPEGTVERWGFEFGPPNALFRRGWTKSAVPAGMKLTSDGRRLFAGTPGSGAPEPSE